MTPPSLRKRIWKGLEQAVGGGLTSQIADCYAAIISVWVPGDRIYLFGFSRGAYCVRCVAHVLEVIGIPTTEANGEHLSLEPRSLRGVAKTAVTTLYRFGLPQPNEVKRSENAATFRRIHNCKTGVNSGAIPFVICISRLMFNSPVMRWRSTSTVETFFGCLGADPGLCGTAVLGG